MAVSGTISGLNMDLVPPGGDVIVENSVEFAATRMALDATTAALDRSS